MAACTPGCGCGRCKPRNPNPTKSGLHQRLKKARGVARGHKCVDCGKQAAEWSQTHGTDGMDLQNDYDPRCQSCHVIYDRPIRPITEEYRAKQSQTTRENWRDPEIRSKRSAAQTRRFQRARS